MLEYQTFYAIDKEGQKEYYDHAVTATSKPENPMEAMSDIVSLGNGMLGVNSASSMDPYIHMYTHTYIHSYHIVPQHTTPYHSIAYHSMSYHSISKHVTVP
jgi:hypothetical protein